MVGGDIAANEDSAIAFCNKENPKAPGAKVFPDGFVASVHWASGDGWVQITVRRKKCKSKQLMNNREKKKRMPFRYGGAY